MLLQHNAGGIDEAEVLHSPRLMGLSECRVYKMVAVAC